jgi:hypothetical protein
MTADEQKRNDNAKSDQQHLRKKGGAKAAE